MTHPLTSQPANQPTSQAANPYVGPRTFTEQEGRFFFGREREARDLTARIVSERLLLFYAQSGAGKSSLLNARVIPKLRDEERFQALPVGRVSGDLPDGIAQVGNIFAFNLMASLDQGGAAPARLAEVTLSGFLARLTRETATGPAGQPVARWIYRPEIVITPATDTTARPAAGPRFALVIDQFEEIITGHPERWREREGFFRQLNQALLDDPNLWVVLSLREDYVAALDPYAELCFNRLRARFYMERMGVAAALEAVREPARLGRRPFAAGVAEKLVDDLRQVRAPGQQATVPGQYVEPVQLQVVCYQLWENLEKGTKGAEGTEGTGGTGGTQISLEDLARAGDVDRALAIFYENAITSVIGQPALGVSEQQLRTWFSTKLITETGTRGTVFRNEQRGETAGLPNAAVDVLTRQFLLRTELRAGGSWVELVHDRFVEPILQTNRARQTPLALDAEKWQSADRDAGLFYEGQKLQDALQQIELHPEEHSDAERAFLRASKAAQERRKAQRRRRMQTIFGALGLVILVLTIAALAFAAAARSSAVEAERHATAQATAMAHAETAEIMAGSQQATAAALQTVAVAASATAQAASTKAVAGEATAQAANTAQVRAVNELEIAVQANLTVLAGAAQQQYPTAAPTQPALTPSPATPGVTPRQTETATRTRTPTPPPTPDRTVVAYQTQLAGVRVTQTALAAACRLAAGAAFARAWDRNRIGCPTAAEAAVTSAYESFERGWMLWRKDTDKIYVFFDGGELRVYTLPEARPEFSCQDARTLGNPRLGFGKVWCDNADVRQRIGKPTAAEVGGDRPLQEFERGFMIYVREQGGVVAVYSSGQWAALR